MSLSNSLVEPFQEPSKDALAGKVALVTGASRGIGKAILLALAKSGAKVIGTATTEKGRDAISDYLKAENCLGYGEVLDIADFKSIDETFARIQKEVGAPNILVNNAGITADNLFLRMKEDEWIKVINTNLTGAFHLIQACLRPMLKARFGRIVSITSVVGSTGNPGQANYAAAKAGLVGLTKSLAKEVGSRGITVNAVAPGFIDTDMTRVLSEEQRAKLIEQIPLARIGEPKEVADAVLFLVSNASYITGETLHINGGMFMC